jgi:two-component system, NtrC family, response regulator AtoC
MSQRRVLVVDDDRGMCEMLATGLAQRGMSVVWRVSADDALRALASEPFDAAVADMRMPGMDGLTLCRRVGVGWPDLPIILMTAFGTFEAAVDAMRAGAHDILAKPFELDELAALLAATHRHAPREATAIVGESPVMVRLRSVIRRVARTETTVLIAGDTGTGKELVARGIHDASARRDGPFVALNCAALPESLADSELFGHVKGAFTDAAAGHAGVFARASGGTLFLDEVSELSLRTQAKMLRALEQRVVRPLGSAGEIEFDARIVAATNRSLEDAVACGEFRQDLLFRLQVVQLEVPRLRERGEDVILLANHFLARDEPTAALAPDVVAAIRGYAWPGNVRELRNCIEHALAMRTRPIVTLGDLPDRIAAGQSVPRVEASELQPLRRVQHDHVIRVLEAVGGNRARAARILGIGRRTLYRILARARRASAAHGSV